MHIKLRFRLWTNDITVVCHIGRKPPRAHSPSLFLAVASGFFHVILVLEVKGIRIWTRISRLVRMVNLNK